MCPGLGRKVSKPPEALYHTHKHSIKKQQGADFQSPFFGGDLQAGVLEDESGESHAHLIVLLFVFEYGGHFVVVSTRYLVETVLML